MTLIPSKNADPIDPTAGSSSTISGTWEPVAGTVAAIFNPAFTTGGLDVTQRIASVNGGESASTGQILPLDATNRFASFVIDTTNLIVGPPVFCGFVEADIPGPSLSLIVAFFDDGAGGFTIQGGDVANGLGVAGPAIASYNGEELACVISNNKTISLYINGVLHHTFPAIAGAIVGPVSAVVFNAGVPAVVDITMLENPIIPAAAVQYTTPGGAATNYPAGREGKALEIINTPVPVLLENGSTVVSKDVVIFSLDGTLTDFSESPDVPAADVGAADGVAPLDSGAKVPVDNLPVDIANGICPLDGGSKVPIENIPASIMGGLSYRGTWDAFTDSTIETGGRPSTSLTGDYQTASYYYLVSGGGTRDLGGGSGSVTYKPNELVVSAGTRWQKIDSTSATDHLIGSADSVNNELIGFSGTSGKLSKRLGLTYAAGVLRAIAGSLTLKPADNNDLILEVFGAGKVKSTQLVSQFGVNQTNSNTVLTPGQIIRAYAGVQFTLPFAGVVSGDRCTVLGVNSTAIASITFVAAAGAQVNVASMLGNENAEWIAKVDALDGAGIVYWRANIY